MRDCTDAEEHRGMCAETLGKCWDTVLALCTMGRAYAFFVSVLRRPSPTITPLSTLTLIALLTGSQIVSSGVETEHAQSIYSLL